MNRRNVLIGLGTAAASSGLIFGSGAFTQLEADRTLNISVNTDNSSSVLLEAGGAANGNLVSITDGNELTFGLSSNTLNSTSDLVVGDTSLSPVTGTGDNIAFLISDSGDITDGTDVSLGVSVSVDASAAPAETGIEFTGDSDVANLGSDANTDSDTGNVDTSSTIDDIAGSSSFVGDQFDSQNNTSKAQFVLNANHTNRSTLAGGVLVVETDSVSTSDSGDINISITAAGVDDSTTLPDS